MSCIRIALLRKCNGLVLMAYVGVWRDSLVVFLGIRSIRASKVQCLNGIMPRYQTVA